MVAPNLLAAYAATCYEITKPKIQIYIGQENTELSEFLKKNDFTTWTFITAWNPYSKLLSAEKNNNLNLLLQRDLEDYRVYTGAGKDPKGIWPPEASFFVPNISREKAVALGNKYKQNAIVYGSLNESAALIILQ